MIAVEDVFSVVDMKIAYERQIRIQFLSPLWEDGADYVSENSERYQKLPDG